MSKIGVHLFNIYISFLPFILFTSLSLFICIFWYAKILFYCNFFFVCHFCIFIANERQIDEFLRHVPCSCYTNPISIWCTGKKKTPEGLYMFDYYYFTYQYIHKQCVLDAAISTKVKKITRHGWLENESGRWEHLCLTLEMRICLFIQYQKKVIQDTFCLWYGWDLLKY